MVMSLEVVCPTLGGGVGRVGICCATDTPAVEAEKIVPDCLEGNARR